MKKLSYITRLKISDARYLGNDFLKLFRLFPIQRRDCLEYARNHYVRAARILLGKSV